MRNCWVTLLTLLLGGWAGAQLPPVDRRAETVRDVNTPRTFGTYPNLGVWNARAAELRSQILFSCGLSPLPQRTPLEPRIFGRVEGDGFTAEKVQMQTSPGVYLAGNLYRPKEGTAPFPAILCPHGHWKQGRLEDTEIASVPQRCIQLARLGFVVFSHDMIGYQDSTQFTPRSPDGTPAHPAFYDNHVATLQDPALQLWNLNLLGQQLWNGIRALDFLTGLPDVDPDRLGCTGASGGGTQTFLLAAVDFRIKASVPAVMVSHSMQGGCVCENAPGLRISGYNVEYAAATAPRPQLLIGATGDWTKTTLEKEGPDVARIYALMNATNRFRAVCLDFPHNYNQSSREVMYGWFARWLLGRPPSVSITEQTVPVPPVSLLRLYSDGRPPPGALSESAFGTDWTRRRQDELQALQPTNAITFTNFLRTFVPNWSRALALESAERPPLVIEGALGRNGGGDRVERRLLMPDRDQFSVAVVLVHPDGRAAIGPGGAREAFAARLLENQIPVLAFDAFQTGPSKDPTLPHYTPLTNLFTAYNRTLMQERVQDILTSIAYVRQVVRPQRVILVGDGAAGLWSLLAARAADAVVADAGALDPAENRSMLAAEVFVPGLRLIGGFDGAAALAAPRPFWIHHTGSRFTTPWSTAAYAASGAPDQLLLSAEPASESKLLHWILARAKP
ncbi:MAG: hypothetical protein RIS76_577 [Verrucomicrobiota bacterium]